MQVIAPRAPSGGTQAFIDGAAINRASPSGRAALAAFTHQLGGGTGCGPAGREIGKLRPLTDPMVGASAHGDPHQAGANDHRHSRLGGSTFTR